MCVRPFRVRTVQARCFVGGACNAGVDFRVLQSLDTAAAEGREGKESSRFNCSHTHTRTRIHYIHMHAFHLLGVRSNAVTDHKGGKTRATGLDGRGGRE